MTMPPWQCQQAPFFLTSMTSHPREVTYICFRNHVQAIFDPLSYTLNLIKMTKENYAHVLLLLKFVL
jgi:hypothetical protein